MRKECGHFCENNNGKLVSITTQDEFNKLIEVIMSWIHQSKTIKSHVYETRRPLYFWTSLTYDHKVGNLGSPVHTFRCKINPLHCIELNIAELDLFLLFVYVFTVLFRL